jgi:Fe-S-cluster containining protein
LLIHTVCQHLQSDNRCGIYATRPQVCRDYSTENCEFEDEHTYDRYFETPEQVAEYTEARFSDPADPNFRTPLPVGLPVIN